jgi:hypothetical protein
MMEGFTMKSQTKGAGMRPLVECQKMHFHFAWEIMFISDNVVQVMPGLGREMDSSSHIQPCSPNNCKNEMGFYYSSLMTDVVALHLMTDFMARHWFRLFPAGTRFNGTLIG